MATNALYGVCDFPTVRKIHEATIRAHHAKKGYDYPTIHLPPTFSPLIGLTTRIFETVHDGALAFLVVVSPDAAKRNKASESSDTIAFTRRGSSVRIASSPSFFLQSDAIIVADDEDDKEEKLPTDEELPTSADDEEMAKEEEQEDYVVEVPGGIIY